jgi:hypothetical protein
VIIEWSVLAPFFKGGKTSPGSWLSGVDTGKWAPVIVEWPVLAPFFKGANESRCRQIGTKDSRVVGGAGSLFQGRQHLIWKLALESQRRQMGTSDSRVVGAGSLFQGRQHLIGKQALESRCQQRSLSRLQERFLLVSKPLQWRIKWFWRQTKGIRMDNGG